MAKKKKLSEENIRILKTRFNDICMRELGLDIDDDDRIFDMDNDSIIKINEKYLKYVDEDEQFPVFRNDEIEFNMLFNTKTMQTLFGIYLDKYALRKNIYVNGYYQIQESNDKGRAAFSYMEQDTTKVRESDEFYNESVRIFNLICKLNGSTNLYDFKQFDALCEKDKSSGDMYVYFK